jgi:hypothetical protein
MSRIKPVGSAEDSKSRICTVYGNYRGELDKDIACEEYRERQE